MLSSFVSPTGLADQMGISVSCCLFRSILSALVQTEENQVA